jgi:hypothetical protein
VDSGGSDRDQWRALVNTVTNLRFLAPRSLFVSYINDLVMTIKWSKYVLQWYPIRDPQPARGPQKHTLWPAIIFQFICLTSN